MQKTKTKKVIALSLAIIILVMSLMMQASAASINVSLTKNDQWVSSLSMSARQVQGSGSNSSESSHWVYFIFYYRRTTGEDWCKDTKKYVKPGNSFNDLKSFKFNDYMLWCYQLNTTGQYKGSTATGSFWKKY